MILGAGMLDVDIPLLASNQLLQRLGAVIDLPNMAVWFATLGIECKIVNVGGHLAVDITVFPQQAQHHPAWRDIALATDWQCPDPELLTSESSGSAQSAQPPGYESHAAAMACRLEAVGLPLDQGGGGSDPPHGQGGAPTSSG